MMKKTSGRKKIEIKKIEKTESGRVTFTKRRRGLLNKASELCVLSGAEIAILAQSKGGRVFAFGHPSVDSVIDTYLGNNVSNSSAVSENPTYMLEEYNKEYGKICKELEVEKNKFKSVERSDGWWEKSFENLEVHKLETFINSLEKLKFNLTKKADELKNMSASSSSDHNIDGLLDELLSNNFGDANEDLMTV
ncbi:agamous-like MADS-box protein AGL62 [Apium graveolens]|uniref:agamous-like MADS-box protein AGL62 n=1 Tax=Apium graveolens TaxID=4045 RepID=UPI003D79A7DB